MKTLHEPLNQNNMKAKLIKTSKDSHHNGHYFLNDDDGFAIGSSDKDWCKRAVKKRPLYVLSLTNCQAIERGYDLGAIIKNNTNEYITTNIRKFNYGFEKGFQKALEILGDKKFTEEDMCKCFRAEIDEGWVNFDYYIQSLQQTEWDVTFDPEEKDAEGRLILKRK